MTQQSYFTSRFLFSRVLVVVFLAGVLQVYQLWIRRSSKWSHLPERQYSKLNETIQPVPLSLVETKQEDVLIDKTASAAYGENMEQSMEMNISLSFDDWIPSDDWLQQCVQRETENPINYQKKYRAQWHHYQLGDCLGMCKSCASSRKQSKLKDLSIVGEYWTHVCHKVEFSETFNITFLSELFDNYQVNPHPYSQPWPKPADDELVIHLRIGDVIDEPQYSGNTTVYQMLRNGADTRHGKNSFYRNGIKSVGEYLSTIRASGLNKVVLRGGSHFAKVYPKSRIFTACLAKTIERAGFNITSFRVDGEANPDQDFFYMSHAKHFVLATGGYSRLISRMVEYRGGSVISSAPNQGNSA